MVLTPLDADKEKFRVGFRGYSREDVERFRALVITTLEEHIALESQLKARVAELESQVKRYRETEELVKDSVVLAQRTCDELISAAHQKADVIKQEARQEGSRIRGELAELRSQREQFEYAFYGLLTGFKHRLEQGNPALGTGERPARYAQLGPAASPAAAEPPVEQPVPEPQEPSMEDVMEGSAADDNPAEAGIGAGPGIPPVPAPPSPVARPAAGDEVDRDADIADFTAALDDAGPREAPPGEDWLEMRQDAGLFGILDKIVENDDPEETEG